ncbi:hypothetical protein AIOL_000481 [Candidatus Rhodobacter oscarellae]|uniref:Uncharacterized protein n=1 Tax=Candidatus Rhodobacter oscarellae TaxID=1675527 RepID=A0A0J9H3S3_9RHOB|nr:DUF6638 family protein [Candidatus Rhodobacter lobularis]KMW60328.1 hypothetical protein AIOL_000481 [Candidatus Rhodobacter lobularis]
MKRLIEKGLMFGNLIEVSSPALVDRYRRALRHLTGKDTALTDFHIDISGYSPEIGMELDDPLYLNPNGVNRQFILLTTEQKRAPLLNAKFSFSRQVLREFIEQNESKLFALTTRDAVAGELQNSVLMANTPARLMDIRRIVTEADTTGGDVANARELTAKIERFKTEEDAWWDDVLIAEMIGLAKETGDVTRNPVDLEMTTTEVPNYWTAHFGGLYVWRDVEHPAVIASGAVPEIGGVEAFSMSARNRVAAFLDLNHLVEPIVKARGTDASAILRQKMDFIVVDAAASTGQSLQGATRRDLRMIARGLGADLPEAYLGLADLVRWIDGGGDWPKIDSKHPAYFYTLRGGAHMYRDLVNQMLAELAPLDVRQLFICHKELFYGLYKGWEDGKRGFVADFLDEEYQVDKAGTRAALFGPEPGMTPPGPPQEDPEPQARPPRRRNPQRMVELVGPWGAVKRGR